METYMRNSGWSFSDSDNDTYNDNTTMENNADSDDDDGGGKQRAVETELKPAAGIGGGKSKWKIHYLYDDDDHLLPYDPGVNTCEDGSFLLVPEGAMIAAMITAMIAAMIVAMTIAMKITK
jgi:hypothetical protein